MTVFVDKNPLELEILSIAVGDRTHSRTVMGICDRASWYHKVAYTAIQQVAKHGKVLDQHVRDHPHVKGALLQSLSWATPEDVEKLCWNHACITNSDTQLTLLRITDRPGYEDLRTVLGAILWGNLEALECSGEVPGDDYRQVERKAIQEEVDLR